VPVVQLWVVANNKAASWFAMRLWGAAVPEYGPHLISADQATAAADWWAQRIGGRGEVSA
jgi:hypothetical protein